MGGAAARPGHQDSYRALNFIAIDLQLYKMFKITRVSVFGDTVYIIMRDLVALQPTLAMIAQAQW